MNSETVKVGMVGLGLVANSHIKGYATHQHAQVVAVCDANKTRAEAFAAKHGIANVYTSYEEMLQKADIDAVDIATPTFLHIPMTQKAAEAGKHIHCEKPFCRSIAEGQEACQAVRRKSVKLYHLQLEMHLFFLPSVVDLMGITPFEQIKIGASGNHNGISRRGNLCFHRVTPESEAID